MKNGGNIRSIGGAVLSLQLLISDGVSAQNAPIELPEIVVETGNDDVVGKIDNILKNFPPSTPYIGSSYTNIFIPNDRLHTILKDLPNRRKPGANGFSWGYMQEVDTETLEVEKRVQRIAKRLFETLKTADFSKYEKVDFYIVITKYIDNAFYRGDGRIEIGKILADRLDDDELAIIIGHEIGHGLIKKDGKNLQGTLKLFFDRENEKEVDFIGYTLAVSAGFSRKALYSVMRKLGGKGGLHSTHPGYVERIVFVRSKVQEIMK